MSAIPPNYVQNSKGEWCHPSRVQNGVQTHAKAPPSDGNVSLAMENVKSCLASQKPSKRIKSHLNKRETIWKLILEVRGITGIMEQAITLRLDPPFKSYTPDLAYFRKTDIVSGILILVEVKGPHRFRRAGIAKAALAAKTYPQFRFELADWTGKEWKESVLSP